VWSGKLQGLRKIRTRDENTQPGLLVLTPAAIGGNQRTTSEHNEREGTKRKNSERLGERKEK